MPRLGIPGVGTVAWGTHFCLFYKSVTELRQLVVLYFQTGLEDGECCVWITAPPLTQSEALRDLERVIPKVQGYLDSGQLHIIPYSEWYLHNGTIDSGRILGAWLTKLEYATRQGFNGLRAAGDASWLNTKEQRDAFIVYEQMVTDAALDKPMIALCAYPTAAGLPEDMLHVMQCHRSVVLPRSTGWKTVEVCSS